MTQHAAQVGFITEDLETLRRWGSTEESAQDGRRKRLSYWLAIDEYLAAQPFWF